jgi:hypothetical protein
MLKILYTLLVLSLFTPTLNAVEITECYIGVPDTNVIQEKQLENVSNLVSNKWPEWDDSLLLNTTQISKKSCELIDWLNKRVSILAFTLSSAGYICEKIPQPYVQTAGVLLSISGIGIQSINLYFHDDAETCKKQEIEEHAKEVFKDYLKSNGATVN